jgi:hypothetical protein
MVIRMYVPFEGLQAEFRLQKSYQNILKPSIHQNMQKLLFLLVIRCMEIP